MLYPAVAGAEVEVQIQWFCSVSYLNTKFIMTVGIRTEIRHKIPVMRSSWNYIHLQCLVFYFSCNCLPCSTHTTLHNSYLVIRSLNYNHLIKSHGFLHKKTMSILDQKAVSIQQVYFITHARRGYT